MWLTIMGVTRQVLSEASYSDIPSSRLAGFPGTQDIRYLREVSFNSCIRMTRKPRLEALRRPPMSMDEKSTISSIGEI